MPSPRRAAAASLLALAAAAAFLLRESLFGGSALAPAESLLALPPWNGVYPPGGGNPLLSDIYLVFTPLRHFLHESVLNGYFPLWNPNIACGAPFLGAIQAAALYPVNLLLAFVHPFYAAGWAAFLKLLIAGFFTWLYLRRLRASAEAALFSALSFAFCGFLIAWLGHPQSNAACLLPALAYFLESGHWTGLALAYAAMILGGHPPTAVHTSLWLIFYAAARFRDKPRSRPAFATAIALGTLLASPQLLPYLEYCRLGSQGAASEALRRWDHSLSPATWTHFFAPHISGNYSRGFEQLRVLLALAPHENFNERTGFVGVLALLLASFAAVYRRREAPVRFHIGAALLCAAAVYGLAPFPRLLGIVPVINSINPTRLLLVICFSLSVLAGLGMDRLGKVKRPGHSRVLLASLGLIAASLGFWLWHLFSPAWGEMTPGEIRFVLRQLPAMALPFAVAGILAALRLSPRVRALLCIGCAAVELIHFADGVHPMVSRSRYYPSTPAIERLRADPSPLRVLGLDWTLPPNTGSLYGLQDARGVDYVSLKRYEELVTGRAGNFDFYLKAAELPAALPALGVKYLLSSRREPPKGFKPVYRGEMSIFESVRQAERALIVHRHRVLPKEEILRIMRSGRFDPSIELLLEENPPIPPSPAGVIEQERVGVRDTAHIVRYLPNELEVECRSLRPAFLLLLDSYYPGWKASVNGRPADILRADYNFRGVPIPAGPSSVRFVYRPISFYAGLSLAALAALLLLYCVRTQWNTRS